MSDDVFIPPTDPDDLRAAWRQTERDWATAVERVESMPPGTADRQVNGEWSIAQAPPPGVRHRRLAAATGVGAGLPLLARRHPPLLLPRLGVGRLRRRPPGHPEWRDILAARAERQQVVREYIADVTAERLQQRCRPGHPPPDLGDDSDVLTIGDCLGTILEEEKAHLG